MKEKEKAKARSFPGYLHPTEEVLWMASVDPLPTSLMSQFIGGVVFCVIMAIFIFLTGGLKTLQLSVLAVGILGLIAVPVFLVMGIVSLFKKSDPRPAPKITYAVTNERLLCRGVGIQSGVSSVPLEEVKSIEMTTRPDGRVVLGFLIIFTVSFPAKIFLPWTNLENPLEVKALIEDARAKRLKELRR